MSEVATKEEEIITGGEGDCAEEAADAEDAAEAERELSEIRRRVAEASEARKRRHVQFAVWEAGINQRYSLVAGRYEALLRPPLPETAPVGARDDKNQQQQQLMKGKH